MPARGVTVPCPCPAVNVNKIKDFGEAAKREMLLDRHAFETARRLSHDAMEEKVAWSCPRALALPAPLVQPGSGSRERFTQAERVKGILQELFLSKERWGIPRGSSGGRGRRERGREGWSAPGPEGCQILTLLGSHPGSAWDPPGIHLDPPKTGLGSTQDLIELVSRSAWDGLQICLSWAWDRLGMHWEPTWDQLGIRVGSTWMCLD